MAIHKPSDHAFGHVLDQRNIWELFNSLFGEPLGWELPRFQLFGYTFHLTKFMILELGAAVLIALIFIPLARRAKNGDLPKGAWWNCFESLLTFVRNEIARPTIGEHDADKFTPFLWTLFLFILFCNLLGLIPLLGSPTASLYATGGLAIIAFCMLHGAAIVKMGVVNYFKSLWPQIDVPYVGWLFSGFVFTIEFLGTFIKSGVLAVRLFANMFAGHLVLAMILIFIYEAGLVGSYWLWGGVTVASVLGITALSLLELFVAFLQAYIFVFLTALFIGMALHPEH